MAENEYPPKLFIRASDTGGQIQMHEPITIRTADDAEDFVSACADAETAARLALCWNSHDALVEACKLAEPALTAALEFVRRARNARQMQMYEAVMAVRAVRSAAKEANQ